MRNRYLLLAIVVILLANGILLLAAFRNRSGSAEATLNLTERELSYSANRQSAENTDVSLRLDWNRRNWSNYSLVESWLDKNKLAELGFDLRALEQVDEPGSDQRLLPKRAYVVLEYAGDAWRRYQADQEAEISRLQKRLADDGDKTDQRAKQIARIQRNLQSQSRLFAVDAGLNPEALRRDYPNRKRFAIVPAEVRAYRSGHEKQEIHGQVSKLLVDQLHVPLAQQDVFADLPAQNQPWADNLAPEGKSWQPRYRVTVSWGRRFEPWIEEVVPLATENITDK